jgi:hypothetical protein
MRLNRIILPTVQKCDKQESPAVADVSLTKCPTEAFANCGETYALVQIIRTLADVRRISLFQILQEVADGRGRYIYVLYK